MTTPHPFPPLATLAAVLLDCACQGLADAGNPVCDCCLHHGLFLPMDGCDCPCDGANGRLVGRVESVQPAPSNTLPAFTGGPCSTPMVQAVIELGVFRCVSVPDPQTGALDCSTSNLEALQFLTDEAALRHAVRCCPIDTLRGQWEISDGLWSPRGPEGGCAGGVLQIIARGLNPPLKRENGNR